VGTEPRGLKASVKAMHNQRRKERVSQNCDDRTHVGEKK
jgi:hypothetical protein